MRDPNPEFWMEVDEIAGFMVKVTVFGVFVQN